MQLTGISSPGGVSRSYGYDSYGYPTSSVAGTIQNYSHNFNSATGNLNWRQNSKYTGLKEDFYNYSLDRLDYIMKGTTTTLDMAYHDDNGDIFTKGDVGSFQYNNILKPYALSEISQISAIIRQEWLAQDVTLGNWILRCSAPSGITFYVHFYKYYAALPLCIMHKRSGE